MSSDKTAVKHDPAAIAARVDSGSPLPTDEDNYNKVRGRGAYALMKDTVTLYRGRGLPRHDWRTQSFDEKYGAGAAAYALWHTERVMDAAHDAKGYEPKKPEPGLEHLHVPGRYVPKGSQR